MQVLIAQTPPAGQLTSDAQGNALGLGLEDVQLLLSAGIDVYGMLGKSS
jgi:hypothetical protein